MFDTIFVFSNQTRITIITTTTSIGAQVMINGVVSTTGTLTLDITNVNSLNIVVNSPDGSSSSTYSITINKIGFFYY